ncbi:MFS transporter [Pantoea agglomerans]|uniref:MFS transporter n=1 Tax=Enterobacter agglomerans TaxID=549 RepID=UPI003FCF174F
MKNLFLYCISVLTITGTTIVAPSLPEFNYTQGINGINAEFLYRITLTLPAFSTAMTGILLSFIRVKIDRKSLLVYGLIGYTLFGVAGYFINSSSALLISRFFLGVAVAVLMYSVTFYLADTEGKKDIKTKFIEQSAFMAGSNIFISSLSGYVATLNWKFPFFIYGISLLILPGVIFFIKRSAESFLAKNETENLSVKKNFNSSGVMIICCLAFLNMIFYFSIPTLLPYFVRTLNNAHVFPVGFYLSFVCGIWCLSSVTSLKINFLNDDFFRITCGFAFLGAGLLLLGLSHSGTLILISLIFAGAGLGLNVPGFSILVVTLTDSSTRKVFIPVLITAIYMGQFLSPILAEPAVKNLGLAYTFVIYGGLSAFLSLAGLALRNRMMRSVLG